MKKRKVWRYTCDFCKKSNCSSGSMKLHEARCFHNPARICPMCGDSPGQTPLTELLELLVGINDETKDAKIKAVEEAASGCPACTLAALNQTPPKEVDYENYDGTESFTRKENWAFSYNYKAAKDSFLSDKFNRPGFQHCP